MYIPLYEVLFIAHAYMQIDIVLIAACKCEKVSLQFT
jgi:hypothetical protein